LESANIDWKEFLFNWLTTVRKETPNGPCWVCDSKNTCRYNQQLFTTSCRFCGITFALDFISSQLHQTVSNEQVFYFIDSARTLWEKHKTIVENTGLDFLLHVLNKMHGIVVVKSPHPPTVEEIMKQAYETKLADTVDNTIYHKYHEYGASFEAIDEEPTEEKTQELLGAKKPKKHWSYEEAASAEFNVDNSGLS
jgi:hypothetical protein